MPRLIVAGTTLVGETLSAYHGFELCSPDSFRSIFKCKTAELTLLVNSFRRQGILEKKIMYSDGVVLCFFIYHSFILPEIL